ncbi:F-box/kelch-repeat protein [Spatholobus suberectus]|nr:F-box/kelch-repeat protein [Spatholobus suberectus]
MKILEVSPSDGNGSSSGQEPQDADYDVRCLSDELETMILARFPISKHWKMCCLSKRFLTLLKSGEIYKIRRVIGFKEPSVFMLASGEKNWCAFDGHFRSCRKLPIIPSDYNFEWGDKESFSAGTHLFVSGKERAMMNIYTCFPDAHVEKLQWKQIVCRSTNLNPFIHNCAVMLA